MDPKPNSLEQLLMSLKEVYDEKMIDDATYAKKKQAIIDGFGGAYKTKRQTKHEHRHEIDSQYTPV